ncbi:MAG: alpha/beta hydrolase [Terriglobia bacterium]
MSVANQIEAPRSTPSRRRKNWGRLLIVAGALLLALYLAIGAVAAAILTRPRQDFSTAVTPATFHLEYRDVQFPARIDHVPIAGCFIQCPGSRAAIILVHGKDDSRTSEFDGRFPEFGAALNQRGLAVLMIDLRGHGQSGAARLTFGLDERRDIQGAADWLKQQGFRPGSVGALGAASAVYATADDRDIGALVEDSGYAAVMPAIRTEWRRANGLPQFLLPAALAAGHLLFSHDPAEARPLDAIGRIAPRAVLIVHGDADHLVPVEHARELRQADPSAEIWIVPGVGHTGAYSANPGLYVDKIAAFFDAALGAPLGALFLDNGERQYEELPIDD